MEKKEPVTKPVSRRGFLKMAAIGGGGLLALSQLNGIADACGGAAIPDAPVNAIKAKSFDHLVGNINGLSASQLQQHIKLYQGYVKKYNGVQKLMDEMRANGDFKQVRDYQLRQSYALNGAVLHDLYFSNLTPDSRSPRNLTTQHLNRDFGSVETYFADLRAVGKKMRGWAITGFSMLDGKIHNYGLDTHDHGTPMWFYPLMVLDVYEHAYMVDYGTNRGAYLDAFMNVIDWAEVDKRLELATTMYRRSYRTSVT